MKRKKILAVLLSLSFVMNGLLPIATYAEEQENDVVVVGEDVSEESTDYGKQEESASVENEKIESEDTIETEETDSNISDATAIVEENLLDSTNVQAEIEQDSVATGAVAYTVDEKTISDVNASMETDSEYSAWLAETVISGIDGDGSGALYTLFEGLQKPLYAELGGYILDDVPLSVISVAWTGCLNSDFHENPNFVYEAMIMNYLTYEANSSSIDMEVADKAANYGTKIYKAFTDLYAEKSYEELKKIWDGMSLDEMTEYYSKNVKSIQNMGKAVSAVKSVCSTGKELTEAVCEYLALQQVKEERIALLKNAREACASMNTPNENFLAAADTVIKALDETVLEYSLRKGSRFIWGKALDQGWDTLCNQSPALKAIDLGVVGLEACFNSTEGATNNFKLAALYTVDAYFQIGMRNAAHNFITDGTDENGKEFIACFQGYAEFQMYGNDFAKMWIKDVINGGLLNRWFTQIFYRENIENSEQLIEKCENQKQARQRVLDILATFRNIYLNQSTTEEVAILTEEVPVTGITQVKSEKITVQRPSDIIWFFASVLPVNATNKTVIYSSSNTNVISIDKDGKNQKIVGAGTTVLTATSEDGGYTTKQTVVVTEAALQSGRGVVAQGTCGDDLSWILYSDGALVISGSGKMETYKTGYSWGVEYYSSAPWYKYRKEIETVILGDEITYIGAYAFGGCVNLLNIIFGKSLSGYGSNAFYMCNTLAAFSANNETYFSQDGVLFDQSKTKLILYPNGKEGAYIIPDGVTTVEYIAFRNAACITEITIGDSVTSLNDYASARGSNSVFYGCSLLNKIVVSSGNKNYSSEDGVLYNKKKSTLICYPRGKDEVSEYIVPDGVSTIYNSAFYNCGLKKIELPRTVTQLHQYVFQYSGNLEQIIFKGDAPYRYTYDIPFYGCSEKLTLHVTEDAMGYDGDNWKSYNIVYDIAPTGFKVKYDANGGTGAPADQRKYPNETISLSYTEPSRTEYKFAGWAKSKDADTAAYLAGAKFAENQNTTLYAVWKSNSYSITYILNGGQNSGSNPATYKENSETIVLQNPLERSGYAFDGWYEDSGFTKKIVEIPKGSTGNKTLYAKWTPNKYSVTFNANGGKTSTTTKSITYDATYGTLPTPTRTGYTFKGWYTAKSGGSKITSSSKVSITNNQTLYAQWAKQYKVTFNANGGSVTTKSKTVAKGYTYSTLPSPTRSKYAFKGWYTKKTGGTKVTKDTKVSLTNNQTIYAHWTKVSVSKGTVSKLTNTSGKKAVVAIKKVSGAKGYQVEYSTSKSFKNSTKKSTTKTSLTLSSLSKGKTYYVRIRGYKLDSKGTKIYGAYSATKKIKITK